MQILQEEIRKPVLTRQQILFWLHRFRKMDISNLEHRQRLIDTFVNAIYVYEDKIILTFNYKEGTKTISLDEINGSDLDSIAAPSKRHPIRVPFFIWQRQFPSPPIPINNPAPARPEIRSEQGLWRLGYAVGAEVPASVSRTCTRRVISRLQVKRVISHSPASRAAGSSASISVTR